VTRALVLAAGNGDRFVNGSLQSKLLHPVLGQPLILRTITTALTAGIAAFEVVLGYQADAVRALVAGHLPHAAIHFTFNPDWHLENGVSVLAARPRLDDGPFALLMGDHLFESAALVRMLTSVRPRDASLLAVDSRPAPAATVEEATKVTIDGSHIVGIGKDLYPFDALDTGMFVCTPALFDALDESRQQGDTSLSGGVRRLAARGLMRAVDIGDAEWYDIDTPADLHAAEARLAQPEHA
jgi:choline kinase